MRAPALANIIPSGAPSAATFNPEFVPLPARGPDPIVGMSRPWWYSAERDGLIQLHRIRRPGQAKGRTLLPVAQAIALIRKLATEEKAFIAVNERTQKKERPSLH